MERILPRGKKFRQQLETQVGRGRAQHNARQNETGNIHVAFIFRPAVFIEAERELDDSSHQTSLANGRQNLEFIGIKTVRQIGPN
jgi:hypothetical protein